jgi:hypothetical protein
MAKKAAKKTTKKPKISSDSLVISLDFDKKAYTANTERTGVLPD